MKLLLFLLHLLSFFFSYTQLQQSIAYKLATMPLKKDANAGTISSTPDSTATIQVPATQVPPMTQEQNNLLFELTRRKFEAELAAAEVEARLRRELIVKESEACVAVAVAAASAVAAGAKAWMSTAEEDDITSEVLPKVTSITLRFVGLPKEEIVKIFQNKFKPINLYCLRFDALQDHDRISIEDGILRLRKMSVTYKDFEKSFYDVLADAFHNYTTIFVSLFSKEALDLNTALAEFYSNVYKLFTVYKWRDAVLPMVFEAHTYIVSQQPTDPSKWVIPKKFQGRFCTPKTMIRMSSIIRAGGAGGSKKRRSRSFVEGRRVKSSWSNNPSISCNLFNKGGYGLSPCNKAYMCKECGSRDHELSECMAKQNKKS